MTPKEFITRIQGYYGVYPPGQRKEIVEYIAAQKERVLDFLYTKTIRTFSSKWKCPPDVAIFEEQIRSAREDYYAEDNHLRLVAQREAQRKAIEEDPVDPRLVSDLLANLKRKLLKKM